jgi:hypothetical protein
MRRWARSEVSSIRTADVEPMARRLPCTFLFVGPMSLERGEKEGINGSLSFQDKGSPE